LSSAERDRLKIERNQVVYNHMCLGRLGYLLPKLIALPLKGASLREPPRELVLSLSKETRTRGLSRRSIIAKADGVGRGS
jgi:hypothetical protein